MNCLQVRLSQDGDIRETYAFSNVAFLEDDDLGVFAVWVRFNALELEVVLWLSITTLEILPPLLSFLS
jgi:hypothetical protein